MQPIAFEMPVPFLGTVPVGWYGLLSLIVAGPMWLPFILANLLWQLMFIFL